MRAIEDPADHTARIEEKNFGSNERSAQER